MGTSIVAKHNNNNNTQILVLHIIKTDKVKNKYMLHIKRLVILNITQNEEKDKTQVNPARILSTNLSFEKKYLPIEKFNTVKTKLKIGMIDKSVFVAIISSPQGLE